MPNKKTEITPEKSAELERLRYQVRRCEDKGLMNTAHHEMLARLEAELGIVKEKEEVTHGEQDL